MICHGMSCAIFAIGAVRSVYSLLIGLQCVVIVTLRFQRMLQIISDDILIPGQTSRLFQTSLVTAFSDRPFTFGTILQGWTRRKNAIAALKAFQIVLRVAPESRLIMMGTD